MKLYKTDIGEYKHVTALVPRIFICSSNLCLKKALTLAFNTPQCIKLQEIVFEKINVLLYLDALVTTPEQFRSHIAGTSPSCAGSMCVRHWSFDYNCCEVSIGMALLVLHISSYHRLQDISTSTFLTTVWSFVSRNYAVAVVS